MSLESAIDNCLNGGLVLSKNPFLPQLYQLRRVCIIKSYDRNMLLDEILANNCTLFFEDNVSKTGPQQN